MNLEKGAIEVLARASRSTPRVANRLLKRMRDYVEVNNVSVINEGIAKETLSMLEVDILGLDPADRRFLEVIISKFGGGPVGVGTLSAALNEDRGTIEDIYEPYLMNIGLLDRTPSGRVATAVAYEHLGIKQK